ncbi:MAG: hypothetical protein K0S32_305 [Bacteroidetes bacterium]|jgi:hypothetical protein|nr:hypothetical protein [Bacteroidota bacterium]
MNEEKVLKQIKINEATVSLRSDGIITVLFHKNIVLDLALQMLLLNIYNKIADGKRYPFLFEASSGVKITKEAKENALRIESQAPGSAYAVIAPSRAYQLVANFYLTIKKTQSPYKVFMTREKAIEWLKGFL